MDTDDDKLQRSSGRVDDDNDKDTAHDTKRSDDDDKDDTDEMPPQLPTGDRGYFACRTCRRILSEPQWYTEGCTECLTGPVPRSELAEYATAHFHNFVGLVAPAKSWVARLMGKTHSPNGVYAEALSDSEHDGDGDGDDDEDEGVDNNDDEDDEDGGGDERKSGEAMGDGGDAVAAVTSAGARNGAATTMTDDELLNMH